MAPKDLIENVLAPKLMEGHNFLHLNESNPEGCHTRVGGHELSKSR